MGLESAVARQHVADVHPGRIFVLALNPVINRVPST